MSNIVCGGGAVLANTIFTNTVPYTTPWINIDILGSVICGGMNDRGRERRKGKRQLVTQ